MFQNLAVFKTAYAMAVHAGQKQAIVAQNVANADTPGYIAQDLPSFGDLYARSENRAQSLRATRDGHLHGATDDLRNLAIEDKSFLSPDGNSVSIDAEMLRGVEAKRQHDRSLAIYGSALKILRASLGKQ